MADDNPAEAVDHRTTVMTVIKWNMSLMGAMVKGKMPFNNTGLARHVRDLATAARLGLLAGFPQGSDGAEDTNARMVIWMVWEGFENKYASPEQAAKELGDVAGRGDLKAIAPKFGALGKACKTYNDAFKD